MPLELPDITDIQLDAASLAIIADTHQLARKVNEFRPLAEPTLSELRRRLMTEEVYHSNAIEGSTLSLRETAEILATGELYLDKQREAQEALNLMNAIQYVETLRPEPSTAHDLKALLEAHRLILTSVNEAEAGHTRNHPVMIRAAKYQPPDSEQVDDLMTQFLERLSNSRSADQVLRAAWAHWTLARIHPFGDGNGRIARLWQNLVLFQGGLTAALIRSSERKEYYEALQLADGGEFNPFVQFVARCCQLTLQEYLNAQQAVDELQDWAKIVIGPATITPEELTLRYTRWALRMESLRDAFERCAAQLTKASRGEFSFAVVPSPILSRDEWESLWTNSGPVRLFFRLQAQSTKGQVCFGFTFEHVLSKHNLEPVILSVQEVASFTPPELVIKMQRLTRWKLLVDQHGFQVIRTHTQFLDGLELNNPSLDALTVAKQFLDEVCSQVLK